MSEKLTLFTKILKAELEDLEEDFEQWSKFLEDRRKAEKITEYVFMENMGLLLQELASVRKMVEAISQMPPQEFQDIEAISSYFEQMFRDEVKKFHFPEAVLGFVLRKIDKVYAYLKVEED